VYSIDVSQRGNKQMPEALEGIVCSWCDPQVCLSKEQNPKSSTYKSFISLAS